VGEQRNSSPIRQEQQGKKILHNAAQFLQKRLFMIDCGGKDNGKNRSYSKKSEKKVVSLQPGGIDVPSNRQRKQK